MEFNNLQDFRNVYKGKPIFVAGAGPSLRFVDSSLAENYIVIAVNASIMKFTQAKYFFTCDASMPFTNVWGILEDLNCKIIEANNETKFGVTKILENRIYHLQRKKESKMNLDDKQLIFGTSSVHVATHFAYILGGDPIILVGCDCCLSSEEKIHYSDYDNQPDYTLFNTKSLSKRKQIYKGHLNSILRKWVEIRKVNPSVNIINASGGCLDAFPRENLDILLRGFSK